MSLLLTPKIAELWVQQKQAQVLDVRYRLGAHGAEEALALFAQGHWPKAKHFALAAFADASSPYPNTVLQPQVFKQRWLKAGFRDDLPVLLVGDTEMPSAFRVWWLLQWAGFPQDIAVLDGGIEACQQAGMVLQTGFLDQDSQPATSNTSTAWEATPSVGLALLRDIQQLQQEQPQAQLLDARSEARYRGDSPEPRAGCRAGHIAGSSNLPYTRFFNPSTGGLLAPLQLEALLNEAGFNWEQPVISTCGSGVTACVLVFVLRYLGYPLPLSVYDGSWSEWGSLPE